MPHCNTPNNLDLIKSMYDLVGKEYNAPMFNLKRHTNELSPQHVFPPPRDHRQCVGITIGARIIPKVSNSSL